MFERSDSEVENDCCLLGSSSRSGWTRSKDKGDKVKDEIFKLSLEDKLYRTKYETDADKPHIKVNDEICKKCETRVCTYICPAKTYKDDPNNKTSVMVAHENCLECGTCLKTCPQNAIDWKLPDGGMGVKYRFG